MQICYLNMYFVFIAIVSSFQIHFKLKKKLVSFSQVPLAHFSARGLTQAHLGSYLVHLGSLGFTCGHSGSHG